MSNGTNRGAEARRWLSRRAQMGWSLSETARRSGIPRGTLAWWCWRLRSEESASALVPSEPAFVEVSVVGETADREIELVTPGGYRVRVPEGFDPQTLGQLLDVVERRC